MADPTESILPAPTEVTLLTSAQPLPQEVRAFERWSSGLSFRTIGAARLTSERLICPDPSRTAYDPADQEVVEFLPLKSNLPHGCKGFVDDEGRWQVEVDAAIRAKIAWAAARELWTGAITGSPSLQSSTTAVSTSASGALPPIPAIAAALADFEESTQGERAYVHVPSVLVHSLSNLGYIDRKGDQLVTIDGHIVVPGPGYPNSAGAWGPYEGSRPPAPGETGYDSGDWETYTESGTASGDGEVWIYVSGTVEAAAPHYEPTSTLHHSRQNEYLVTARGVTLARFDPTAGVFASLVTVPGV